jgi:hypothetical protein
MLKALSVVALLCVSAGVEGQSWASLSGLKVGQKIQITEMNMRKNHSGTFLSASDSAITFREGSAEKSLQKAEVRTIKLQTNRRLRNTLIGFGAGGGAGAAIGAGMCAHDTWFGPGPCAAVMGVIGAVIGTPIGALIPTDDTVYRADPHKSPQP